MFVGEAVMKRIRIVVLFILAAAIAAFAAQAKIILKVKVQQANVRTEMNLTAAVIKEIKQGTLLEASRKAGEWYEISVTNDLGVSLTGFIHANTVDEVGVPPAPPRPTETVPAKPKPTATPPVVTDSPIEDRGYAPMKSGFKVMAAYGMGNYSYKSDASTSQTDKYKKSLMGIGGGIGYESGGQFGFEIDLMYLPKGVRFEGSTNDFGYAGTFDLKINTAEVSVPLLLKYTIASNPGIYILGGGEIAYIMSAKADYSVDIPGLGSDSGSEDFKANTSSIDYGAVFGGGISLPLGGLRFFVEARYHLGLANMQKNNAGYEAEVPSDFNPKTSLLLVLGGIRF